MTNKSQIKILVVGDPGSIHAAKFTSLLEEIGYEVRIFQSEFYYDQDEHLKNTLIYVAFPAQPAINHNKIIEDKILQYHVHWNMVLNLIKGQNNILDFSKYPRVNHLKRVMKEFQPEIIFSLKMQNDGYTVAEAKEKLGKKLPTWVHFAWGTDLEFFGKNPQYAPKHLDLIRKALGSCDYFMADSLRDVNQAQKFGFKGINLGMCLASVGFDLEELNKIKRKSKGQPRKIILIKGRQGGLVGKAFNILRALELIRDDLRDFQIKIIMPTPEVKMVSEYLNLSKGLKFEIVQRLPYKKLLSLFNQSRIAISASEVDGSPLFLMEAMAMGAFPIHSDMESVREWVKNGENGLLFPVDNVEKLSNCIRKALSDDQLVTKAKAINWQIARKRMDRKKLRSKIKDLIETRIIEKNNEER